MVSDPTAGPAEPTGTQAATVAATHAASSAATHEGTTTLAALRRGDLAGARSLQLSDAGLTELPAEVLALADSLEALDLSHNALQTLPPWFSRLHRLRVLFCSGNRFRQLPGVLGDCGALAQLGCRGTGLQQVPAESLPPQLRWLTLTDNQLTQLPAALGDRPTLEKLMLAGNHLTALPDRLAGARRLALLRVAANRLPALPGWLTELPELAWLAWAGNPCEAPPPPPRAPSIPAQAVQIGEWLGEGASGHIHAARWQPDDEPARDVALKRYKGQMTSDGLPQHEMDACLAAGRHPHLLGAIGRVTTPDAAAPALLMPRLPPHWAALAAPPSRESCSRDVYRAGWQLPLATAWGVARGIGQAAAHLHGQGLLHGDLYAHNTLWNASDGQAVLSDFGAASFLPSHDPALSQALQRLEVRAWGLLLGELLDHSLQAAPPALREVQQQCLQAAVHQRPLMAQALHLAVQAMGPS
jgi:Leucine rich repeat/Protein tyrosine and serine/threonine kinase